MNVLLRGSIAAIVLASSSMALAATAEGNFQRTLTVNGAVTLAVETGSGNIKVMPGSDGQLHIDAHVKAGNNWGWGSNNGSPQERVQKVIDNPPIEQSGNMIRIGKKKDSIYQNVTIDYVITTPKQTELNANSGSGNVDVAGISGAITAGTGSGDIAANDLSGAHLETGSGNVRVSRLHGSARLSTGSGDIAVEQSDAGDMHADTGSGNIEIDGMKGSLNASAGSGNINVKGSPTGSWKVGTGSGNVTLHLPSGAAFELDAESSSGTVHTEQALTVQGDLQKHHIHGTVNGGGPKIVAETGSGDIRLE